MTVTVIIIIGIMGVAANIALLNLVSYMIDAKWILRVSTILCIIPYLVFLLIIIIYLVAMIIDLLK
jgi:hypothetical protein